MGIRKEDGHVEVELALVLFVTAKQCPGVVGSVSGCV